MAADSGNVSFWRLFAHFQWKIVREYNNLKSPGQPQCNACVCLRFCYVVGPEAAILCGSKMAATIDKSNGKT
jgi:hypothetical protein